jgi:transcriptional antiterminator NusG
MDRKPPSPEIPNHQPGWYAVQSACNHERSIGKQLQERKIPFFLPSYKTESRWSDRIKMIERPLFPGYLFVEIDMRSRLEVLRIPSVVRLVGTSLGPVQIPREQIECLQRAMERKGEVAPHDYLNVGDRVRVAQGPFAGMSGILIHRENQLRVVVSIESIQRAFSLNIDIRDLENAGVRNAS